MYPYFPDWNDETDQRGIGGSDAGRQDLVEVLLEWPRVGSGGLLIHLIVVCFDEDSYF